MSKATDTRIKYLYDECLSCAKAAYVTTAPNERYAKSVAELMVGTMAQESHFRHRRQGGFSFQSTRGAWGLMQMEVVGIQRSVDKLKKSSVLSGRIAQWLFGQQDADMQRFERIASDREYQILCQEVSGWDRLGIAFMRLYYLDCAGPVPDTLAGQADYYKRHWNTYAGKATTGQYIDNFQRLVEPALKGYTDA